MSRLKKGMRRSERGGGGGGRVGGGRPILTTIPHQVISAGNIPAGFCGNLARTDAEVPHAAEENEMSSGPNCRHSSPHRRRKEAMKGGAEVWT